MTAYELVKKARENGRPTAYQVMLETISDFKELHGDRKFKDDSTIKGGIGYLNDIPVTVIAIEKGTDINDRIKHNFGMAHPEGYRKALRLMKQAEKFSRPVITFVDTFGAYPGIEAEQRGQGFAISESIKEMMWLNIPTIAVVTGEGGSGGALALSAANEIWMFQNSYYSVISPEGCASILWKDSGKAPEAAEYLKITPQDLLKLKIIDKIFEEDNNLYNNLKSSLYKKIKELAFLKSGQVAKLRYEKFRNIK